MAFFTFNTSTDNRSATAITPLVTRNMHLEPAPAEWAKRTPFVAAPSMGRTLRVTPSSGKNIRGVYCQPGVRDGALFVAAGTQLYVISSSWVATALGPLQGSGTVLFDRIGANLFVLAGGCGYVYDGTTLTFVTDVDFPPNAYTLAALGERILSSEEGSDQFDWSAVGVGTSWPATGFATSGRSPDPIEAQVVVGGDLAHFGKVSTQFWRAMGGDDSEAFDVLGAIVIDKGILTRDAHAKLDSSIMWIGEDRVVYDMSGFNPARVVNRDLELALEALTEAQAAQVKCFSYAQGSHLTWVARLPTGRAFAFDTMTRTWHERTTWEETKFSPCYYAKFGEYHVVASDSDDGVYTWASTTFSDAGGPHERILMCHVPLAQRTIVNSVHLDLKPYGQPLTGQGSDPVMNLTFYTDGGSLESTHTRMVERQVKIGQRGRYDLRPGVRRLGMFNAADGCLLKLRWTDPVGVSVAGLWVNEDPT